MVKAAIASITRIGDNPATIHVLRVSGTLKALRKVRDTTPGGFEYSSVITTEVG
jgi:RNase P/RNase MRP subunit POP5